MKDTCLTVIQNNKVDLVFSSAEPLQRANIDSQEYFDIFFACT